MPPAPSRAWAMQHWSLQSLPPGFHEAGRGAADRQETLVSTDVPSVRGSGTICIGLVELVGYIEGSTLVVPHDRPEGTWRNLRPTSLQPSPPPPPLTSYPPLVCLPLSD